MSSNETTLDTSILTPTTRVLTTHSSDGTAMFHSATAVPFTAVGANVGMNLVYSTSNPVPSLSTEADIATHAAYLTSPTAGLMNPSGSVCRVVHMAPSTPNAPSTSAFHRTQSLDYGIILRGEVELELDGGEIKALKEGDVVVQRGTMHRWRNTSESKWAMMVFVMLGAEEVVVRGRKMNEDLAGVGDGEKGFWGSRESAEQPSGK